jgi:hypothetical protein
MLTAFGGALALTIAALVTNLGRDTLPWVAIALGLYVVAVVIKAVSRGRWRSTGA